MALTRLRPKPATKNGTRSWHRRTPKHDHALDGLTAASLYDLQLHGLAPLAASALDVRAKNAMDVRRLLQVWQAEMMSYYSLVPEVKFSTNFMGQMLYKVRLYPAILDPKTHEPEELHDGAVFNAFQRIQDRSGGRGELQRNYGKLKYLIGETYLTISPDEERGEVWECLSPNELRVQPGGLATRFRAPMLSADQYLIGDMKPEQYVVGNDKATVAKYGTALEPQFDAPLEGPEFRERGPDVIVVYRLWRQSPAYSWLADCNMQALTGLLEELVLSQASVRAQLKSRLNQSGLLMIPDEASFTSLGNNPEEDPNSDVFQERLTEAIMAGISDPGTAASLSPIVARIAGELIQYVKYIRFNDNTGELAEISQRAEMIERFGIGAELPPELFKSQADLNHWTGWLIDEQTWKSYGAPAAMEMADDLCAAYLQPTLKEDNFADWENVRIGVDPSAVINHPDRAKDADALYGGLAISKKVWRESKGYNDNDAMPDNERAEQIGIKTRDSSLAWDGIPQVRGGALEPAPGEIESAVGTESVAPAPTTGSDIERGAPQTGPRSSEGEGGPALQASGVTREGLVMGACGYAVRRARTMAGSRLRALTQQDGPRRRRCEECAALINGVPNWAVAAALGQERVIELVQASEAVTNLVDGAAQELAAELEAVGLRADWAAELGRLVEAHAARTLYDAAPASLPPAFTGLLRGLDRPLERT